MKFKVSTKNTKEDEGIVYILLIKLEDKDLVKIGVTGRDKVEDRVIEILLSIYKTYRYFPYCYTKRFRKTSDMFEKEAILHRYFKEYNYKTEKVFGGSTEVFDIPLDDAVAAYEKVLQGEPLDDVYVKSTDEEPSNTTGEA